MRSLFFLLALVIPTTTINFQEIKGIAKDQDGKAMSGATISLLADTGLTVMLKFLWFCRPFTRGEGSAPPCNGFTSIDTGSQFETLNYVLYSLLREEKGWG